MRLPSHSQLQYDQLLRPLNGRVCCSHMNVFVATSVAVTGFFARLSCKAGEAGGSRGPQCGFRMCGGAFEPLLERTVLVQYSKHRVTAIALMIASTDWSSPYDILALPVPLASAKVSLPPT